MASGFITLQDGNNWSSRWTGYDFLLETVMNRLQDEGDEGYLKGWLKCILPNEDEGDIESGWSFFKKIKEDDYDMVLRIMDTRLMKDKYRKIFFDTVEKLNGELDIENVPGYHINSLYKQYQYSLEKELVIPVDNDDSRHLFMMGGYEVCVPDGTDL